MPRKASRAFRRLERIIVFAVGFVAGAGLVIMGEDIPFFRHQDPLLKVDDYLRWVKERQVFYATTVRLAVAKEAAMQGDRDFAIWLVADEETKSHDEWHTDLTERVSSFRSEEKDIDNKTLLSLLIEDWHAEFNDTR